MQGKSNMSLGNNPNPSFSMTDLTHQQVYADIGSTGEKKKVPHSNELSDHKSEENANKIDNIDEYTPSSTPSSSEESEEEKDQPTNIEISKQMLADDVIKEESKEEDEDCEDLPDEQNYSLQEEIVKQKERV